MKETFEFDNLGVIVYKAIGKNTPFSLAAHWVIEPGSFLEEVVSPLRTVDCACGVNFATLRWIRSQYPVGSCDIWKCRIRMEDWFGVIVSYHTDGKARCARLELLEIVESIDP